MKSKSCFIFDFDSTFIKVEALELLADISLKDHPDREKIKAQISAITNQSMEGKLPFRTSLEKRIALLAPHRRDLEQLAVELQGQVSDSFVRNRDFFEKNARSIYILSNGFHVFIDPVATSFGIRKENIFANSFRFDEEGRVTGVDTENPLAGNNGKVIQLKKLDLHGDIYVIGDGYTDYEIKQAGLANKFFAFTENVARESILPKADHVTPNLDEFLYLNRLNASVSYPKNRIRMLVLENISPIAIKKLEQEGFSVDVYPAGMSEDMLAKHIKGVAVLCIRSKTRVTEKVLKNANRLMAIGAFCIGTNQIDLEAASEKGVVVFNAPFSNTRSVAELALAELIMLMRNLPDKWGAMHKGKWDKSAKGSSEVRGKKLGIIGYGNIGSQLSVLAENIGMQVYYYDITERLTLGNAVACKSLRKLLSLSDAVSLHVDGRTSNRHLIGKKELAYMKKGAILLNLSRGNVVDMNALKEAILSERLAGCGVDVFPSEPFDNEEPFTSVLQGLPNTLLTPHIGGSTLEAQENIAHFVSDRLMDYINTGSAKQSVNFPYPALPSFENAHRLIHIHQNKPGVLAQINATLADHNVNIIGQHLQTNDKIGYVITDIDRTYDESLIRAMRLVRHTIKFRVLY